ncbi:hypothetical protein SBY92_003600 [Candida maltosa Xu316]|uniref:Uncharacterized protein n=1 Tax=Candida maltosa (strain Xu316) TaxID=1245528 RepID=M3JDI4_CANMX|nr:hypothetical protein G210_4719 [Candida maltosa Xu316]
MSDTPILSYKKPSANSSSQNLPSPTSSSFPSTPILSQSSSPIPHQNAQFQQRTSIESPRTTTTRKISSRRKALQDFYHLNEGSTPEPSNPESIENIDISKLENIDGLIKNSPIEDILKLRNEITLKLSSSSQTKKSIIYDNYYELIKLNNTLSDLSTVKVNKKQPGFKFYDEDEEDKGANEVTKEEYVDSVLDGLEKFVNSEGKRFNGSFSEVLDRLNTDSASDSASMVTIKGTEDEQLSKPEKQELVDHINYILALSNKSLDDEAKEEAIKDIDNILSKNSDNEVLTLQLTKIKESIGYHQ